MDWKTDTVSLEDLQTDADDWDYGLELIGDYEHAGMVDFLKFVGAIPHDVEWKRRNAIPQTSMDADAIPAGYLAEVALEWDDDGFSTAGEFVAMLRAEVSGTPQNTVISETMQELGST